MILSAENQYSTAPNTSTLSAFTEISRPENTRIHSQPGSAGNQSCMYSATAVTSVPTASTMQAQ